MYIETDINTRSLYVELAGKGIAIVDHRVLSNHTVNPRVPASEGTKDRVANNGFPRLAFQ